MGKKRVLVVGPPKVIFDAIQLFEEKTGTKAKAAKPKKGDSITPDGIPLTPFSKEATVSYTVAKSTKSSSCKVKYLFLDDTVPLEVRTQKYAEFLKKKPFSLTLIVVDTSSRYSIDDITNLWDIELTEHVRAPRVVVACPTSNDLAASDAEVSEIAFEIASADYVNVKSTSDNWQDKLFAVLGRRAVESAIRIYMETTQKNEKEQRKHLLYERLIRQQTDYGLGTLNLAFIQNTMNSDNVVDNVLMGGSVEADSGKVTDTYSFTQLVEYYNLSKKFGTRGIEQLLLFRDNLTSFEPKALTSEFLESLKIVVISGNQISGDLEMAGCDGHAGKFAMPQLRELHASSNKISSLNPSIQFAVNLSLIDLRSNQLKELPAELFLCAHLQKLDASNNQIEVIPPEVGQCHRLKLLYLNDNCLEQLPQELGSLTNLLELWLDRNKLKKLPLTLSYLEHLRVLSIVDNPIRDVPKTVIDEGTTGILSYLSQLMMGGDKCYRMKLMLVGQENVGKTSLLRAFQAALGGGSLPTKKRKGDTTRDLTQLSGKPLSTDGIDIHTLTVPTEVPAEEGSETTTKDIVFSAWDFAGQEVYYSTHSFFLTERSMFLVVFNMKLGAENTRVEYWLNSIKARAPKAPVFVVGTYLDEVGQEAAQEQMDAILAKYKKPFRLKGAVAVSCATLKNVPELIGDMATSALKEPYMGGHVPTSYFVLEERCLVERNKLEKTNEPPLLDWDVLRSMAVNSRILTMEPTTQEETDKADLDLRRAVDVLHLLGTVVYFPDAGAGLDSVVILQPQYITKIMATIITTKQNFVKEGVVVVKNLFGQVWRQFPEKLHPMLLALLETFEVVFRLPSDSKLRQTDDTTDAARDAFSVVQSRYGTLTRSQARSRFSSMALAQVDPTDRLLVPSLLPEERPDLSILWPEKDPSVKQFTRRYDFVFMPGGLFSRFMIRMLKFGSAQRYWKHGVVISSRVDPEDRALVEVDQSISRLTVYVRGKNPAEFFRLLIELLDSLLYNWFKVSSKISALCPQCVALGIPSPTAFTKAECLESSARSNWFMMCTRLPEDNHLVHMETIAPDIAMVDFEGRRVDMEREVVMTRELGRGAHGAVWEAIYNQEKVAVKQLVIGADETEENAKKIFEEFRKEVWTMSGLQHPSIVNLKGFSLSKPFSMILELVPHGELYNYINDKTKPLDWALRLRIAWDIARGLAFLHASDPPLLHRDMKSPNVLLSAVTPDAFVCAKVCDFGLTGAVFMDFKAVKASERDVENPTWLAPEVMREQPYAAPADVYPFGMILWELFARAHPFDEYKFDWTSDLEKAIRNEGLRPTIPADCPQDYADFIRVCWDDDPQKRPSFRKILDDILPPLIDKYAPEIKPYLQVVVDAEQEMVRAKSASREPSGEKEPFKGTFITSIVVPKARIRHAILVGQEIWCTTEEGGILVFGTDGGKLLERFDLALRQGRSLNPEEAREQLVQRRRTFASGNNVLEDKSNRILDVISVSSTMDTIFLATRKGIKFFQTSEKSFKFEVKAEGWLMIADATKGKKGKEKFCRMNESAFNIYTKDKDANPEESIPMWKISIDEVPGKPGFTLKTPIKDYVIEAHTEEFMNKWQNPLKSILQRLAEGLPLRGPEPKDFFKYESDTDAIIGASVVGDKLWVVTSKQELFGLPTKPSTSASPPPKPIKLTDLTYVTRAGFFPRGIILAADKTTIWVSFDADIVRIDTKKNKPIDVLSSHTAPIDRMVTVGDEIWSMSIDGQLRVWEISGKAVGIGRLEKRVFGLVAVDKKVYLGADRVIELWSKSNRALDREFEQRHEMPITTLISVKHPTSALWGISSDLITVWK